MLKLFIKSTVRLILLNKVLSSIKVTGLALGLACFVLLTLFCIDEFLYDRQHPHHERIYRFVHKVKTPEGTQSFAFASATIGPALKERYSEVEAFHRFLLTTVSVRNASNEIAFNEKKFGFADANFLEFFHFPLRNPVDPKKVLKDPYSLLITPATAAKYFGDVDPIGKSLIINGQITCIVNGVFASDANLTHLDFDFIGSYATLEAIRNIPQMAAQLPASLNLETKGFAAFYTYLLLARDASPNVLEEKFPAFIEEFRGKGRSERLKPTLQSLDSIHLNSSLLYEIDQNGSMQTVYIFFVIGALILLIACINYINTTTAEFINRARGTSLKKILGISRASLLGNHLIETTLLTGVALMAGAGLGYLLLPEFNSLMDRKIEFFTPSFFIITLFVLCFTILVSGLYPAWAITRTNALESFKGNSIRPPSVLSLRNVLVFLQLFISFGLVSIAILIYTQIDFLLNKNLGFDSDQVLVVNASSMSVQQRLTLKSLLVGTENVNGVAACSTPPGGSLFSVGVTLPENAGEEDRRVATYQSYVDADYLATLGVEIELGRFFNADNPADSSTYLVVNQAAAKAIGDTVLNRLVQVPDLFNGKANRKSIIGIISDFHFASLRQEVESLILEYNPGKSGFLLVRFRPGSTREVISALEREWKEVATLLPLDFYFLDEGFAKLYEAEQKQKSLISAAALMAVGLAALGIFGTMLFWVQQKTKEISIRKVLGSAGIDLFVMLARPVTILIVVSCALCVPATYFAGSRWLEQYPYRVAFSPVLFALAFSLILTIVLSTLTYHFSRVIRINPASVLKRN